MTLGFGILSGMCRSSSRRKLQLVKRKTPKKLWKHKLLQLFQNRGKVPSQQQKQQKYVAKHYENVSCYVARPRPTLRRGDGGLLSQQTGCGEAERDSEPAP